MRCVLVDGLPFHFRVSGVVTCFTTGFARRRWGECGVGRLSSHLGDLSPSTALTVSRGDGRLGTRNISIVGLDMKRPSFGAPSRVGRTTGGTISSGFSHCSPMPNCPTLHGTVIRGLGGRGNLRCATTRVSYTGNTGRSIYGTVLMLIGPNSRMVIPTPC